MSIHHIPIPDRAEELLIDQVTAGLSDAEQLELNSLLNQAAETLQDDFMRTTALVQLGLLAREGSSQESMPVSLKNRIASQYSAQSAVSTGNVAQIRQARPTPKPALPKSAWSYSGWAMAAAFALLFFVVRIDVPVTPEASPTAPPSLLEQRMAMLNASADAIEVAWAQPDQPDYRQVKGDVVWSDERQQGFMRLSGLPANDPTVAQYQLWIVDPERGEQPVDGGVFDMPAGQDDVIIAINSKLSVADPTVFAITLEQPGGVVVSKGPLLVVAPVTS